MRTNSWITCLWGLGLVSFVSFACFEDRPIYMDVGAAGTSGGPEGAAGTGFVSGGAGTTGAAGTTGTAGTTGAAGTTVGGEGCPNAGPLFETKNCALAGACHDRNGAAASFSLEGLPFTDIEGWRNRLVGKFPKGGGTLQSMCAGAQMPYLVAGTFPATGLLLHKLRANPSCGDRMPVLGDYLTATELDCIQRWANRLVAPSCSLTCAPGTYCRYTYGSPDGGTETSGTYACSPLPAPCNGTLSCGCLQAFGCNSCVQMPDHVRCASGI